MKSKVKYNEMTDEDLQNRLVQFNEEREAAQMKFKLGQFKKTSEFKRLRKEVARVRTLLRTRELKAAGEKG
jgi:ribosomal protein L29